MILWLQGKPTLLVQSAFQQSSEVGSQALQLSGGNQQGQPSMMERLESTKGGSLSTSKHFTSHEQRRGNHAPTGRLGSSKKLIIKQKWSKSRSQTGISLPLFCLRSFWYATLSLPQLPSLMDKDQPIQGIDRHKTSPYRSIFLLSYVFPFLLMYDGSAMTKDQNQLFRGCIFVLFSCVVR